MGAALDQTVQPLIKVRHYTTGVQHCIERDCSIKQRHCRQKEQYKEVSNFHSSNLAALASSVSFAHARDAHDDKLCVRMIGITCCWLTMNSLMVPTGIMSEVSFDKLSDCIVRESSSSLRM